MKKPAEGRAALGAPADQCRAGSSAVGGEYRRPASGLHRSL